MGPDTYQGGKHGANDEGLASQCCLVFHSSIFPSMLNLGVGLLKQSINVDVPRSDGVHSEYAGNVISAVL
jgi:hypothetical protein